MRTLIIGNKDRTDDLTAELVGQFAGDRAPASLNLLDPTTLCAIDGYDVIVNARDPHIEPPDEAIRRVWDKPVVFVQVALDGETAERLMLLSRDQPAGQAIVLLGAGLAPGVTNLVASEAIAGRAVDSIEIGFHLAGPRGQNASRSAITAAVLGGTGIRYAADERVVDSVVKRRFPIGGRRAHVFRIAAAESAMLRATTGASTTATYVAGPQLAAAAARTARALGRVLIGANAGVGRQHIRWPRAPITITAIADHGGADEREFTVRFEDARRAHIETIERMAAQVHDASPGVHLPDHLFRIDGNCRIQPTNRQEKACSPAAHTPFAA